MKNEKPVIRTRTFFPEKGDGLPKECEFAEINEKKTSESTIGLSLDQKARQLKFSDKNGNILWGYLKEDVKKHLKEFIESTKFWDDELISALDKGNKYPMGFQAKLKRKAKEIFGKRLIK